MVLQIGNDTIAMRFIPLLIWSTLLSADRYESPILDPTFQFNYTSTEIDAGADSVGSFSGTIYNISSGTVTIAVVRRINALAEGWTSSICVGAICYNESVDSVAVELSAGDSTACGVLIWINGVEGTGTVQLDLFDLQNIDENIIVNLNIYTGSTVGIDINSVFPKQMVLYPAFPNPFNPVTILRYNLPKDGLVNITIHDMMGRIVRTLENRKQAAGLKSIQWNATNDVGHPVSAGPYLYTITSGYFKQTKKMVLLK
jgi:hypothetical protein